MEINAFVTLRGTIAVGTPGSLPPAVREILSRSLSREPPTLPPDSQGQPLNERVRRISGAIAGSIFHDLVSGAIRVGEGGPPPASEAAIAKLERGAPPPPGATCTICMCALEEPAPGAPTLIRMPCGHDFHEECLLQWVREHNTCPLCRFAIEGEEQPRVPPLFSMLQGWREAAAAAPAGAPSADDVVVIDQTQPHHLGRGFELPLGVELRGGQMRLFHADLRELGETRAADASARATPGLSAAFERISSAALAARRHHLAARAAAEERSVAPELLVASRPGGSVAEASIARLSIAELKQRLEALGVQPPPLAQENELVRLVDVHERLQRITRRSVTGGLGPQLRLQVQMQMVQMPPPLNRPDDAAGVTTETVVAHPVAAPPARAASSLSPRRSGRRQGRGRDDAGCSHEEENEADDSCAHRSKRHCSRRP